jgi:hypothetical protein
MQALNLSPSDAAAVCKSIRRRHPFFQSGGMFGHDWRTFRLCYPLGASILYAAMIAADRKV